MDSAENSTIRGIGMWSQKAQIIRAMRLEYFTVVYNILEGVLALVLGGVANSVALIGFGMDSFVETFSGLVVLRRFRAEFRGRSGAEAEQHAIKYVGFSFFLLAAYIGADALHKLVTAEQPDSSLPGVVLAAVSLLVMPILARKKRQVGRDIRSKALVSDSKQTLACSFLSGFLLMGLAANAAFGWWWADPVGAVAMVPWLVQEGREAIRGELCCD
jgi:divalent metal cation (Fe/Co/Zn/Cd) transporter